MTDKSNENKPAQNPSESSVVQTSREQSDVSWLKYRFLAQFLTRLQRRVRCSLEISSVKGISIIADESSARTLNRYIASVSFNRFWKGAIAGAVAGVIAAYIIIPTVGTYVYSSRSGILPPEYDALLRTKNVNEQVLQVLEHSFEARTKGAFGRKRLCFEATINDSSTVQLNYETSRKGLIMSVSQKVGSNMAADMVRNELGKVGVDTIVGKVAGGSIGVSDGVGDAVGRAASMSVEKGYRANPVISITTRVDGVETEYVNWYAHGGVFSKDFCARDADTLEPKSGDYTRVKREYRTPSLEDQKHYAALLKEFLTSYRAGMYTQK